MYTRDISFYYKISKKNPSKWDEGIVKFIEKLLRSAGMETETEKIDNDECETQNIKEIAEHLCTTGLFAHEMIFFFFFAFGIYLSLLLRVKEKKF